MDNDALACPVDVMSLVAYQEGSIVSRTLVKDTSGTVTVFAFGAGQALSEHTAPFDALVLALDGLGDVTIGGETQVIEGGQMIRLPANVPHAIAAREPFKMLLVMIRSP